MEKANKTGSVTFECPNCLKEKITRSQHQRKVGSKYKCGNCGFTGPN